MSKRTIHFFYPVNSTLTGQEMASLIIKDSLKNLFNFNIIEQPSFSGNNKNAVSFATYFLKVLSFWSKCFLLMFHRPSAIYLNIGQTLPVLIRDGIPILFLKFFKPSSKLVLSIHNNHFMHWKGHELSHKIFYSLLRRSSAITILGERQKSFLLKRGVEEEKLRIVNNTCSIKLSKKEKKSNIINILYLSNLLPDKGYKEFLEALKLLNQKNLPSPISVTFCGPLYEASHQGVTLIQKSIDNINIQQKLTINWIKGAYGDEKKKLFENADIFVLPSKNEAQPIVLIEAMASGCALITSKVGEIPSMVNEKNTILLNNISSTEISEAIIFLCQDLQKLGKMKAESKRIFLEDFSLENYKKNWTEIFNGL